MPWAPLPRWSLVMLQLRRLGRLLFSIRWSWTTSPRSPVPCPPSIYCIPLTLGPAPHPHFHLMTRRHSWFSSHQYCRIVQAQQFTGPLLSLVCWQAWLCSLGASVRKDPRSFTAKKRRKRKSKQDLRALFLNIESWQFLLLLTPVPHPPPATSSYPEEKKRLVLLLSPRVSASLGVPRKGVRSEDTLIGFLCWFALEWLIVICFGFRFGACRGCISMYLVEEIASIERNLVWTLLTFQNRLSNLLSNWPKEINSSVNKGRY